MPRRSRQSEYFEDVNMVERGMYLPRPREEYVLEHDARYSHRVLNAPPVEVVERRRVRDQLEPQLFYYARDSGPVSDAPSQEEPRKYDRRKNVRSYRSRGRRRSRNLEREEEEDKNDEDEEYYSFEEDSEQKYTDSESGEAEAVSRSPKRSIARGKYLTRREITPRSRSMREGEKGRRSDYDLNDGYRRRSGSRRERTDIRKSSRYEAPSVSKHRSHYHVDLEEDGHDLDGDGDDVETPVMITRHRRRGARRQSVEENSTTTRNLASSSSTSSSSSSSSSRSELEVPVPRASSLARAPLIVEDPIPQHVPILPVSLPLVLSPETTFEERDARHRRRRRERIPRENPHFQNEDKDLPDLSPYHMPPEHFSRRKKDHMIDISSSQGYSERENEVLLIEDERRGQNAARKQDIVEEKPYQRWNTVPPQQSPDRASSVGDWAIVKSPEALPPPAKEEVTGRQHKLYSRNRERRSRLTEDEEGDAENGTARTRGKIGRRYIGVRDRRESLWTEITKDLVVKEAIERAGYEYEETESFYYIFSYLHHDDISALIQDSADIRRARRRRIQEIHRERASLPPLPKKASTKVTPIPSDKPPSPRRNVWEEQRRREWEEQVVEDSRWRARSGRR